MGQVTYANKIDATVKDVPEVNKIIADDMNSIKTAVNDNDNKRGVLANLLTTVKTSIVNSINELYGLVSINTSKVSADGSVTTHLDVSNAGSGQIITATERNKLTNVSDNSTLGRAVTDADFNNHENITNNGQTYSFDGVSNGFMMTFSTITGVTSTLTKTGEPSRVLEENSYYLVTYFNNVFKISPE